jgi:hypothetical protein
MPTPFSDFFAFLIGNTPDHNVLGVWKWLFVVLFIGLLAVSFIVAIRNWQEDPQQRTGENLILWFLRVLIGGMWFQGMLWKLPLPVADGLKYWTEQMGTRAAFAFHRELVKTVYLPNLFILDPIIFLAEFSFAASLILGFGVRLVSALSTVFVLHLWLGLYRPGDPAEWPWTYVFLAVIMFMFSYYAAGRSLGVDALLRRDVPAVRDGKTFIGKFFRAIG